MAAIISAGAAANLGLAPALLFLSGKQSPLLLLVNLFAVTLADSILFFTVPLTLICVAFSVISDALILSAGHFVFLPVRGLLYLLEFTSDIGQKESYSAILLSRIHPMVYILFVILCMQLFMPVGYGKKRIRRAIAFLLPAAIVSQMYALAKIPDLTVVFADVGQGDCILIVDKNHNSILIDGGNLNMGRTVVSPLLDAFGIKEPDITVVTHLDADHITGILELIEKDRIHSVYTGFTDALDKSDGTDENPLYRLEQEKKIQVYPLRKNDKIYLGKEMEVSVLWPDDPDSGGNEDSVVLLIEYGDTGFLFTGDIGEQTERRILADVDTKKQIADTADFLKTAHHGSRFSSSLYFLDETDFRYAVICVGKNFYGHPSPEILEKLEKQNIDYFRTDLSGAVIVEKHKQSLRIFEYAA